MSDLDLDAIEARANAALNSPTGQSYDAGVVLSTDVPALVAEVRSLRTHLAHAAEVEAALTSDLLAAHVEVEQLRVTRAAMEEELAKVLAAIALAGEEIERASVEVKRADRQHDDARAEVDAWQSINLTTIHERDDWRRRYEALRNGVTGLCDEADRNHEEYLRGIILDRFIVPSNVTVRDLRAVVARVEGDDRAD